MMYRTPALALILILAPAAGAADMTEGGDAFNPEIFYGLDLDGDGYVSDVEIVRDRTGPVQVIGAERSILLYDADGDGALDVVEFERYWLGADAVDARTVNFAELDMNANGVLERDEIRAVAPMGHDFDRLDADGDGRVERGEYVPLDAQPRVEFELGRAG